MKLPNLKTVKYKNLEVTLIPVNISFYLGINYIFIIRCYKSGKIICVDPGHFGVVDDFISKNNLQLDFIIITHKHSDHVGGIKKLKNKYNSQVVIYEDDQNLIRGGDYLIRDIETKEISDLNLVFQNHKIINPEFRIGEIVFSTIKTFGHCANHISFFVKEENLLFCGDTLFSVGCGRINADGSYRELFESLNKIKNLPKDTQIYCAHEYTLSNIDFALNMEPNNQDLISYKKKCEDLRAKDEPTIPAILSTELKVNPFLRTQSEEIRETLYLDEDEFDVEVFRLTRREKDNF